MIHRLSTAARAAAGIALLLAASAMLAPAHARKDIQLKAAAAAAASANPEAAAAAASVPHRQLGEMRAGGAHRSGFGHRGYDSLSAREVRWLGPGSALPPAAWFGNAIYGGMPITNANWYYSTVSGQRRHPDPWLTNVDVDSPRYQTMSWRDWDHGRFEHY